jgi:hypothetical protein
MKKSYAGAVHSPVEGGWISNLRPRLVPLVVLLIHIHIHRGGAVPGGLLASDDGDWIDPLIVPPSQELVDQVTSLSRLLICTLGADPPSISLSVSL